MVPAVHASVIFSRLFYLDQGMDAIQQCGESFFRKGQSDAIGMFYIVDILNPVRQGRRSGGS